MSTLQISNTPGTTSVRDFARQIAHGTYYDSKFSTTKYRPYIKWLSIKSPTLHSDHKIPTTYNRAIRIVLEDSSSIDHITDHIDGRKVSDYKVLRSLLFDVEPCLLSLPSGITTHVENSRNEAVAKARNALKGDLSVDNGTNLGEARQTYNMLAGDAVTLLKAYKAAKKGNWSEVANVLGVTKQKLKDGSTVSERWLAYQYGWRPLMGAIHDNYNRFMNHDPDSLTMESRKGARVRTYKQSIEIANNLSLDWDLEIRSRCGITASLRSQFTKLNEESGLLNPAVVAWELVPFSFVVDWFMPIGNVLSAYSSTAGLDFRYGYLNHKITGTGTLRRTDDILSSGRVVFSVMDFSRTNLASFPIPGVYGRQNPFTTTRALNALALLRTAL